MALTLMCAGAGANPPPDPARHAGRTGTAAGTPPSSLVTADDGRRVAPDIARIINRGELVVAMLATDVPPFFYEKDGRMAGTDVQIAEAMASELGVKVRYDRSARTFNQVAEVVADGKADIALSKLGRTLARAQQVLYSDPYLALRQGLLVNRVELARLAGERPVQNVIRQLDGRICVLAGTSWQEFGRRYFPRAEIVPFKNWTECVEAVKRGDVAAAYRDEFEVRAVIKRDPKLSLTLRTVVFTDLESSLAIAVNGRDTVLLGYVNQFIAMRPEKLDVEGVLREVR